MRNGLTLAFLLSTASVLAALSVNGCVPLVAGAATSTGVAVAQDRSVGAALDDTGIAANVNGLLLKESGTLFRKVGVEVNEGRVLLTGAVSTPDDRIKATMVTWRARGVKEVINELQVTDKGGVISFTKDAWITTQLRAKILTDTKVLDINYSVETVNGVIYLLGIAQSQAELDRVTSYARNISGVERVVSYVRVPAGANSGAAATPGATQNSPNTDDSFVTPPPASDGGADPNSDLVIQSAPIGQP